MANQAAKKLTKTEIRGQYDWLSRNKFDCSQAVGEEKIRAYDILEERLAETSKMLSRPVRKGAESEFDSLTKLYLLCQDYANEQPVRNCVKEAITKALAEG